MYVPQRTWIKQPGRGLGTVAALDNTFGDFPDTPDYILPCLAGSGPLRPGQDYCPAPSGGGGESLPVISSGFCMGPVFPFVGTRVTGGSCLPAFNVPSPWNYVATAGVAVGALMFVSKLFGRGRR
jgi:hypothetical protein